ncbi:hypothetical protein T484DRAFT_1653345, partial [Baffinella frigidus]
MSSDAADGPTLATPVVTNNAVGRLWGDSLGENRPRFTFDPAVAGETSNLLVTFLPTMDLAEGEVVTMRLPDFSGASNAAIAVECSTHFLAASWDLPTTTLTLTVANLVPELTPISLLVPNSSLILLPTWGIIASNTTTSIGAEAVEAGPRPHVPIIVPALGTFSRTVLRYESVTHSVTGQRMGKKNTTVELFLTLVPTMTLMAGETVTLHLTAFLGGASAGDFLTTDPPGLFRFAVWTNNARNTSTLSLTVLSRVNASSTVAIHVSSLAGIRLPLDGVKPNQTSFWISSDASDGPVHPPGVYAFIPALAPPARTRATPIEESEGVGSLMSTPAVQWLPPFAGRVTAISLYLVPKMEILPGGVITFVLPPLLGNSSSFVVQYLEPSEKVLLPWNASWESGTRHLTLTVGSYVPIDSPVQVVTPTSANIFIPVAGLIGNDPSMQVYTTSPSGPVPPTRLSATQGVSSVRTSHVAFFPTRFGAPTTVTLTAGFALDLAYGDHFLAELPGFAPAPGGAPLALAGPFASSFDLAWSVADESAYLHLTFARGAVRRTELLILQVTGLRMPVRGVEANDRAFTLALLAPEGAVPATPFDTVQAVGGIYASSVSFSLASVAAPTNVSLAFTPAMALAPGDSVTLLLSNFTGRNCSVSLSTASGSFSHATYNLSTSILRLTVGVPVPANSPVSGMVPADACGLTLPRRGLKRDEVTFRISVVATAGSVPDSPATYVEGVPSVGSLMGSTRLEFLPAVPARPTTIKFSFTGTMAMAEGESLTLTLPSLYGASTSRLVLVSSPPGLFSRGEWTLNTTTLRLVAQRAIPQDLAVVVYVLAASGIT